MADEVKTKVDAATDKATAFLTNKQTRSAFLLIVSFIIILLLNAVLPVIQGDTHYTAEAVDMTYGEYVIAKQDNNSYNIVWISEQKMDLYILRYIASHPELSEEEKMLVTVPDTFMIRVYTKYFFEYPFWYVTTFTSIGSAIILFYSIFQYLITRGKERNLKYRRTGATLDILVAQYLDPIKFEPWMDNTFNQNRKIQQHKSNVKYLIDKLERKTSYNVKRVLRDYFLALRNQTREEAAELLKKAQPLSRSVRRYLNRKERLLALLDPDYIKEYVVSGKVKYFKYVYPMFVYNGQNTVGHTIDSYSLLKTDGNRISNDAGRKVIVTITITLTFAVLLTVTAVASYQQDPFWIVVNAIAKISPLFIQVPLAIDYSNTFMENQLIGNLLTRRNIGLLHLADTITPNDSKNVQQQISVQADAIVQEENEEAEQNAKKNKR